MAQTSKYGFNFVKHLTPGVSTPATLEVTLANSAGPLTVGDTVGYSSGYLDGVAADAAILGVLVGFVDQNGRNIFQTGVSSTGTKSGDDTYTAAADNITVDFIKGVVYVDPLALFFAYADSSLTQAEVGLWFNGVASDGTYVDSVTGAGGSYSVGTQQFQLIELVTSLGDGTASTDTGLFRIGRTQLIDDPTA